MAISKIQKINNLEASINYCCNYLKTDYGKYVSTYQCNLSSAVNDFERINTIRKCGGLNGLFRYVKKKWKVKDYMIVQSFKPNEVNAETAHEIGMKLAKEYLGDSHQFIVSTHIDKGHIHNHIIFNATKFTDFHSFDSKTKHIINELQNTNDKLCEEYGLSVIKEKKEKGISQREYYARKNDRSYKRNLEKLIDSAIEKSNTWNEFISLMKFDCDINYGKHISFRQNGQERFTRAKTLGIDYSEESIKYRIEHKELEFERIKRFPALIDKKQKAFQGAENGGLRNWATRQNINNLASIANAIHTNSVPIEEQAKEVFARYKSLGASIDSVDSDIAKYTDLLSALTTYKNLYSLIQGLKVSKDKGAYKKAHFNELKKWDNAKKIISKFKGDDGKAPSLNSISSLVEELKVKRSIMYIDYQNTKAEINQINKNRAVIDSLSAIKKQKNHNNEL